MCVCAGPAPVCVCVCVRVLPLCVCACMCVCGCCLLWLPQTKGELTRLLRLLGGCCLNLDSNPGGLVSDRVELGFTWLYCERSGCMATGFDRLLLGLNEFHWASAGFSVSDHVSG